MASEIPTFEELEETAVEAIRYLKLFPEFSDAKIAVIGGTALWKYFPSGRTTLDVDFIITLSGAPQVVKNKLLQLPNSPFAEYAQIFVYKHPSGKRIQIDFTPDWQSAYVPAGVTTVKAIDPANPRPPYISPVDLLVLKINTCGIRPSAAKKTRDALDALAVADMLVQQGPIRLTDSQKAAAQAGIDDVISLSERSGSWWTSALQL